MNVDPKWLMKRIKQGPRPEGAPEFIETDLPCGKCGYNLRGLKVTGSCPECGTSFGRRASNIGMPRHGPAAFHDLPLPELSRVGVIGAAIGYGMPLMSLGWLTGWVYLIVSRSGAYLPAEGLVAILTGLVLPGALGWALGISAIVLGWGGAEGGGLATVIPPMPVWMRRTVVIGAWAWVVVAALTGLSVALLGASAVWSERVQIVAVLVGLGAALALGPTARLLFELSAACDDDFAFNRMRGAVVGMPIVGFILVLHPSWGFFIGIGLGIGTMSIVGFSLILVVPVCLFIAGVWSLGRTLRWARRNAREALDREERFRAKSEAHARTEGPRLVRDGPHD